MRRSITSTTTSWTAARPRCPEGCYHRGTRGEEQRRLIAGDGIGKDRACPTAGIHTQHPSLVSPCVGLTLSMTTSWPVASTAMPTGTPQRRSAAYGGYRRGRCVSHCWDPRASPVAHRAPRADPWPQRQGPLGRRRGCPLPVVASERTQSPHCRVDAHDTLRPATTSWPIASTAIPRGAPKKVTTVTVALAAAPSVWPSSSSVLTIGSSCLEEGQCRFPGRKAVHTSGWHTVDCHAGNGMLALSRAADSHAP